jgi:hypothetical protein
VHAADAETILEITADDPDALPVITILTGLASSDISSDLVRTGRPASRLAS